MNLRLSALSLAALAGALVAFTPAGADARRRGELREVRCDYMEVSRTGRMVTIEAPDLHVLRQSAAEGPLPVTVPQGMSAVLCGRTHVLPAANDDEVLTLGLPLFIAETGTPGRLGVLEVEQGSFRFRMIEGQLDAEEQARLDALLATYQRRLAATS